MAVQSRERWCFATICLVTLLAYIRSFSSPFNLDDYAFIVGNRILEQPTLDTALRFARVRFLPFVTFIANYRIGGEDVFGYHVVNFVVHLLATFAVYRLVLELCRSPRLHGSRLASERLSLAVAAAFFFACHPIQIQAVTYVVQRITSLATLFYIGSVLLYVRGRNVQEGMQTGRAGLAFTGAVLLALAAFLSKENTASLPLAIVIAECAFYPGRGVTRRLLLLTPFFLLVLVMPVAWYILVSWKGEPSPAGTDLVDHIRHFINYIAMRAHPRGQASPLQYMLTQCVVIPRYFRLVVLPWGFNIDHDVPLVQEWNFSVAAGLVFLITLLGFGIYALRRWPLVGFGIAWIFLGLSVESSFLPIQDAMVEHRMYLAMPGIALLFGVALASALPRWPVQALAAGAAVITLLCVQTVRRNELWREPLLIWQDAVDKSPKKARVHANLGTALHQLGRLDEAITKYCYALELDPQSRQAESNAFAAKAEKMERELDTNPRLLKGAKVGEDGTVELDVPNPCQRWVPRRK